MADPSTDSDPRRRGDALRKARLFDVALEAYLEAAAPEETPDGDLCLKIARCLDTLGRTDEALGWVLRVVDTSPAFVSWQAAGGLLRRLASRGPLPARRTARVAIVGSYTTTQITPILRLALLRLGIDAEMFESDYGQYQQAILDPASALYAFEPDVVVMAVHAGDLAWPVHSTDPDTLIASEVARWTMLYDTLAARGSARLVVHGFVPPAERPFGHLESRLPGGRAAMVTRLNRRLAEATGDRVAFVDCEGIAASLGTDRWFDTRYWHLAKQAVSLEAVPELCRHTAAVIAGDLGLARKCVVLDLDNTLWGGVIGEDGLAGIRLGQGDAEGEAYLAFQRYVLDLKAKGIILAVCSKNNDADAREPFEKHPEMQLGLDDFAVFVANWTAKPENLREIARSLDIGLDSLVFVDDNPAEREIVRQMLPDVEVITLPPDPAGYVTALDRCLLFETTSYTTEDAARSDQYRARAEIARLQSTATNLDDFHRSLKMQARIAPFDDLSLPRVVQLIGKSNQFNLTTRRHGAETVRGFASDPDCVHFTLSLRDRFADHGLVSVMIAFRCGETLDIDTWLMSCRVIGRTVEAEMLAHLCQRARSLGCTMLRGTYVPSARNAMVADVFERFGFDPAGSDDGDGSVWTYELERGVITNDFIEPLEASLDVA